MMLVDTDVVIWNLRGNRKAADLLDQNPGFMLSAVTWMELMQGLRDKQELRTLRQALRFWSATIQPINETISSRAIFLMEEYSLSHGMQMADALIAATGLYLAVPLLTANEKHYRPVNGLEMQVFVPD